MLLFSSFIFLKNIIKHKKNCFYSENNKKPKQILIKELRLQLQKDIVLVGPPSSGKSSLLTRVTKVLPKIYLKEEQTFEGQSTTMYPILGHLKFIDSSKIILMEFPAIILNKIEKTHNDMEFEHQLPGAKLYCFVLDVGHPDVIFQINYFMANKHVFTIGKDFMFVLNKADLVSDEIIENVSGYLQKLGVSFQVLSVYDSASVSQLVKCFKDKMDW
jgi:GTPase involved in cell partitioning and DNA repair